MWWIILAIWIFLLVRPKNEQANESYCGWFSSEKALQKMRERFRQEMIESDLRSERLLAQAKKEKYERWNALEFDDGC